MLLHSIVKGVAVAAMSNVFGGLVTVIPTSTVVPTPAMPTAPTLAMAPMAVVETADTPPMAAEAGPGGFALRQSDQAVLKQAFAAVESGDSKSAESLLTRSIATFEASPAAPPPDELSALYRARADVRASMRPPSLEGSAADYTQALWLLQEDQRASNSARADPAEFPTTYMARAAVERQLGRWGDVRRDLLAAEERLSALPGILQTNPYLYKARAEADFELGMWEEAAFDSLEAEQEFAATGDRIRATIAAGDVALARYGAGDYRGAAAKMVQVFRDKGSPTSNNPDDIPLLQELSRTDAELHLAYAADLFANGQKTRASEQWESGCIRLEAYVQDGLARFQDEERARMDDVRKELGDAAEGPGSGSIQDFATSFTARLNGLDPDSPYVTQRPGKQYFFYKIGNQRVRRTAAAELAKVDEGLSCVRFRNPSWVQENRPRWPPTLANRIDAFAKQVPQEPIIMPVKGSPPAKGEVNFVDLDVLRGES